MYSNIWYLNNKSGIWEIIKVYETKSEKVQKQQNF